MNVVLNISKEKIEPLQQFLESKGVGFQPIPSGFLYKANGTNISIYLSGKVLIQGKDTGDWEFFIKKSLLIESNQIQESVEKIIDNKLDRTIETYPRIGSDESGKGDFFGPLVTASFFLKSKEVAEQLRRIGVIDSKKVSDKNIPFLASQIKKWGLLK